MKEVYINEDRLLEGDQSNISIYRIVFYAEVFIMVKNGSMTFFITALARSLSFIMKVYMLKCILSIYLQLVLNT